MACGERALPKTLGCRAGSVTQRRLPSRESKNHPRGRPSELGAQENALYFKARWPRKGWEAGWRGWEAPGEVREREGVGALRGERVSCFEAKETELKPHPETEKGEES